MLGVMRTTRFKLPQPVAPMLASASEPPSGLGWVFEFKWDGVRAIAAATGDQVRLYSRNGNDITGGYPELAVLSGLVGDRAVLLDGEIVALDDAGRPVFGLLQQRSQGDRGTPANPPRRDQTHLLRRGTRTEPAQPAARVTNTTELNTGTPPISLSIIDIEYR
jgi:hypothetical protein